MANHLEQKSSETLVQQLCAKSCEVFEDGAEYLASWPVGQSILKHTDKCLWTVEKCAEWSIPNSTKTPTTSETNGTFGKPAPLVRPLPWLFFLPLLLCMRIFRACLNVGALFAGVETVKPADMVRFVQIRRRKVRALKFLGLRQIRCRKNSMHTEKKGTWNEIVYNKVMSALCFSKQYYIENTEKVSVMNVGDEPKEVCSNKASRSDLKRKYIEIFKSEELDWEDIEDDEELMKKIDKMAENNDIEDDLDFVPAEGSESEEDSMSEPEDETGAVCKAQVLHRPNSHNSLTKETIEEENEDSDSTTVSANSDVESTQHTGDTDKTGSPKTQLPVSNNIKADQNMHRSDSAITSDEYYSPQNSISVTPEPSCDLPKNIAEISNDASPKKIDNKEETENFINSEKNQVTPPNKNANNNNNSNSINAEHGVRTNSTNSHRGNGKKHKNRRRFSRLLRRKRK